MINEKESKYLYWKLTEVNFFTGGDVPHPLMKMFRKSKKKGGRFVFQNEITVKYSYELGETSFNELSESLKSINEYMSIKS